MTKNTTTDHPAFIVEACFPLRIAWKLKRPLTAEPELPPNAGMEAQLAHATAKKEYEETAPATAVFMPQDSTLDEEMEADPDCKILFRHIELRVLELLAPIYDEEDYEERKALLHRCDRSYYLRVSGCGEFVIFQNPGLQFMPGKWWRPPTDKSSNERSRRKRKRSARKPTSKTQRRKGMITIRYIGLNPLAEDPNVQMVETYATLKLGDPRFKRAHELNYDFVRTLEAGQILNPRQNLSRAWDPELSFLAKDDSGNNVLTNFVNISIPLFWPDWSDSRLSHLSSLMSWTARSYEAFVLFLEGKMIDSLDEFTASDRAPVERLPDSSGAEKVSCHRDRRGQCYDGDYEKLSVVGPYFLFRVRHEDKVFFILDSPFYGVALRGYSRRQDALDYIEGGEKRAAAEARALWPRLCHDPDGKWRQTLAERIAQIGN